ncbi:MAG: hypothetical protein ACRDRI_26065, partial [Pseudonocardiaceae bacterium]
KASSSLVFTMHIIAQDDHLDGTDTPYSQNSLYWISYLLTATKYRMKQKDITEITRHAQRLGYNNEK